MTHLNLAELDLEEGQEDSARKRLESVKERIQVLNDVSYLADWGYFLAKCLVKTGDFETWQKTLEKAKKHFEDLGKDARVAEICHTLEQHIAKHDRPC